MQSFEDAHRALYPDIHRTAYRQRIRGMSRTEVENEMVYALWKAWKTFDPATGDGQITLARYWWRVWLNHKCNLIEASAAMKRTMETPVETIDLTIADDPVDAIPPCPVDDALHRSVWMMLARGFRLTEVMDDLSMTKHNMDVVLDNLAYTMCAGDPAATCM